LARRHCDFILHFNDIDDDVVIIDRFLVDKKWDFPHAHHPKGAGGDVFPFASRVERRNHL
jgi:hypothetical protein